METMHERLFAYDRRIVTNSLRAALTPWRDRLTALVGLLMLFVSARIAFVELPPKVAAWAVIATGSLVGLAVGRTIASRLAFHAFDGLLAVDALRVSSRQRYLFAWHAVAMTVPIVLTLVARPALVLATVPAYAAGAVAGHATLGIGLAGLNTRGSGYQRAIRSWLQRPSAGLVGAMVLAVSLTVLANVLGTDGITAIAGIAALLLALALTGVDHGVVRFQTIAGHGAWRIIARHARGVMLFLLLATVSCAVAVNALIAAIVATMSAAAVLLMILRILAYRLHGQRAADVLVSLLVALLVLVTVSLPAMLPVVAMVMLWQLHRRAAATTWLLA